MPLLIRSNVPDVEAWLLGLLRPAVPSGVTVANVKPKADPPYRQIIIRADLQNRATPITRYCRLSIQAWSVRADQTPNLKDAFDLAADAGRAVEAEVPNGILIHAEIDAGPYRVVDTQSGIEYAHTIVLCEINVS